MLIPQPWALSGAWVSPEPPFLCQAGHFWPQAAAPSHPHVLHKRSNLLVMMWQSWCAVPVTIRGMEIKSLTFFLRHQFISFHSYHWPPGRHLAQTVDSENAGIRRPGLCQLSSNGGGQMCWGDWVIIVACVTCGEAVWWQVLVTDFLKPNPDPVRRHLLKASLSMSVRSSQDWLWSRRRQLQHEAASYLTLVCYFFSLFHTWLFGSGVLDKMKWEPYAFTAIQEALVWKHFPHRGWNQGFEITGEETESLYDSFFVCFLKILFIYFERGEGGR